MAVKTDISTPLLDEEVNYVIEMNSIKNELNSQLNKIIRLSVRAVALKTSMTSEGKAAAKIAELNKLITKMSIIDDS